MFLCQSLIALSLRTTWLTAVFKMLRASELPAFGDRRVLFFIAGTVAAGRYAKVIRKAVRRRKTFDVADPRKQRNGTASYAGGTLPFVP